MVRPSSVWVSSSRLLQGLVAYAHDLTRLRLERLRVKIGRRAEDVGLSKSSITNWLGLSCCVTSTQGLTKARLCVYLCAHHEITGADSIVEFLDRSGTCAQARVMKQRLLEFGTTTAVLGRLSYLACSIGKQTADGSTTRTSFNGRMSSRFEFGIRMLSCDEE